MNTVTTAAKAASTS